MVALGMGIRSEQVSSGNAGQEVIELSELKETNLSLRSSKSWPPVLEHCGEGASSWS